MRVVAVACHLREALSWAGCLGRWCLDEDAVLVVVCVTYSKRRYDFEDDLQRWHRVAARWGLWKPVGSVERLLRAEDGLGSWRGRGVETGEIAW